MPEITEEELPFGSGLRVKVIWDEWANVPLEERGAVILDAYRQAGEEDTFHRITVAMGATAQEAEKLGIS